MPTVRMVKSLSIRDLHKRDGHSTTHYSASATAVTDCTAAVRPSASPSSDECTLACVRTILPCLTSELSSCRPPRLPALACHAASSSSSISSRMVLRVVAVLRRVRRASGKIFLDTMSRSDDVKLTRLRPTYSFHQSMRSPFSACVILLAMSRILR